MTNQWILTPYFLDRPTPALMTIAERLACGHVVQIIQPEEPSAAAGVSAAALAGAGTGAAAGAAGKGAAGAGAAAAAASDARPDDQLARMCVIHDGLVEAVAAAATRGERPVSVAGDCCATIAVVAGLQRAGINPIVVWLDAHGDFNTHESTLSGFIGGMPLAMITGRGNQTLLESDGVTPLPDTDVILADARDLDLPERALLDASTVTRTSEIERLAELTAGRPIYVHFDVDIIDAAEAPAVLYPVANGPSIDRLEAAARELHATGRVAAVSMTPWALDRDRDGHTAAACWRILNALVGE